MRRKFIISLILGFAVFNVSLSSQSLKKIDSFKTENRASSFVKLDANRYVLVGQKNENWDVLASHRVTFHIFDVKEKKLQSVVPPIADYAQKNLEIFFDGNPVVSYPNGKTYIQFRSSLVYYDGNKAGILLKNISNSDKKRTQERIIYLNWDLGSNQITWNKVISEMNQFENLEISRGGGVTESKSFLRNLMIPIGIDSDRQIFYYMIEKERGEKGWPSSISIMGFSIGSKDLNEIVSLQIEKIPDSEYFSPTLAPSSDFSKLGILEYSELSLKKHVKGHIVDLKKGKVVDFPIPVSPYGAAFDPNNQYFLILSNETGKLVKTNLTTLEQQTMDSIHGARYLVFSNTGKYLFAFSHGGAIEVRAVPSLMVVKSIPVSSLQTNQAAWEPGGSVFTSNGLWATVPESDAISQLGKSGLHLFEIEE
ncbi:hypothetical protein EHQ53_13640 [Leptospira langatensis]|uniref:WD40 repeat domain-containing protein n=1 Tax=Leptospira langatensis TaxID=2484983 RepID=A0A5F1ZTP0_9LEPT|nr:hypothetical protein [Leptospira langatensis]TGK02591.1 hypothetical protein EHO57_04475 [Leptospira langatensis]TGL40208.1 hypothetical protein EHQ53_13640 [Leptospira langatensis]